MVKLTTVVDGQEVVIEGTVEEIKALQEDNTTKGSNVTFDLLSPKERLDTDNKDEEMFCIIEEKDPKNPLNLNIGTEYYVRDLSCDIESFDDITGNVTLVNIELQENGYFKDAYRFRDNDGVGYLKYFENTDGFYIVPKALREGIRGTFYKYFYLEVGKFYEVEGLECDHSNDVLSGKVRLETINQDGDYVFTNEGNDVDCWIKQENLGKYDFTEVEECEKSEDNEEETEENQTEFKRGNIVEVLDEVGGVKEGNYGIVLGYDSDGDVNLAGLDEVGSFSTMWFHEEDGLKLIKE